MKKAGDSMRVVSEAGHFQFLIPTDQPMNDDSGNCAVRVAGKENSIAPSYVVIYEASGQSAVRVGRRVFDELVAAWQRATRR